MVKNPYRRGVQNRDEVWWASLGVFYPRLGRAMLKHPVILCAVLPVPLALLLTVAGRAWDVRTSLAFYACFVCALALSTVIVRHRVSREATALNTPDARQPSVPEPGRNVRLTD